MKKVTANSPSYCINKLICGYQPIYTSGSNYHTSLIQEYMLYTAPHPLKTNCCCTTHSVTTPSVQNSGNKFDSWSFVLGGLPQKDSRNRLMSMAKLFSTYHWCRHRISNEWCNNNWTAKALSLCFQGMWSSIQHIFLY